jgi:predicted nucleic acid-binding protein
MDEQTQASILAQWQFIAKQQDDSDLTPAPWTCQDPDDQIFLNLAYRLRPTILISKDNAVLQIASRAASEDILITNDYNAFRLQN